jgi:hypothetical protein
MKRRMWTPNDRRRGRSAGRQRLTARRRGHAPRRSRRDTAHQCSPRDRRPTTRSRSQSRD